MNLKQMVRIADLHHLWADNEVDQGADLLVINIVIHRPVVPVRIMVNDLLAGLAEDIDVVIPHQFVDLHVGPIFRAKRHRPVQHELHVARSGCFLGGQGYLLGDIAGRYQMFSHGYIIIFHHDYLEVWRHIRIMIYQFLQAQDQMDDILCDGVCRRGLCPEDHGNRYLRLLSGLYFHIFIDHIQGIHLLPLVLMQALDLDVEDRIRVQFQPLRLF